MIPLLLHQACAVGELGHEKHKKPQKGNLGTIDRILVSCGDLLRRGTAVCVIGVFRGW